MAEIKDYKNISISPQYYMGKLFWNVLRWYFLLSIAFIILYPLIYMLSMSFRSAEDFYDITVVWVPKTFIFDNFKKVIFEMDLKTPMLHTAIISMGSTFLQLFVTAMTGYGLARFKFRGNGLLFVFVIITIMVPTQMINIPNYLLMKNLDFFGLIKAITGKPSPINLLNSYGAFFLPAALGQGFRAGLFIFIFRQYFSGLPMELEEAAMIDGCGHMQTYFRIMLPNAQTSLIICGTFSIVWYWGDYYGPYVYLTAMRTLSVQLMNFYSIVNKYLPLSQQTLYYKIPLEQAACIFSILPLIIVFVAAQKYFVQGIEKTGMVE